MSAPVAPASRAEQLRIANLMGVGPDDIEFIGQLSSEALFDFRQQLIDLYFEENQALKRLAKVANMLPTSLIAKITVEAIGPILAARVVGEVDTRAALGVLGKVPLDFVVDTAIQTDPRRIKPLFSQSPRPLSKAVADELIRRKEYVAIGQLIAFVESDVMDHALGNASDIDILLSSFMVEDKARLNEGVSMLSDDRIKSLVRTAADEHMWLEALDLMSNLEYDEFRRIVTEALALDDATLDELLQFIHDEDLWYVGVPAICFVDDPTPGARALLRAKPAVRKSFIAAATSGDFDDEIDGLVDRIHDAELRESVSALLPA